MSNNPKTTTPLKPKVKVFTEAELIHHLIRLGASGDSASARNVQMLVMQQVRALQKAGNEAEAKTLLDSLSESGCDTLKGFLR